MKSVVGRSGGSKRRERTYKEQIWIALLLTTAATLQKHTHTKYKATDNTLVPHEHHTHKRITPTSIEVHTPVRCTCRVQDPRVSFSKQLHMICLKRLSSYLVQPIRVEIFAPKRCICASRAKSVCVCVCVCVVSPPPP